MHDAIMTPKFFFAFGAYFLPKILESLFFPHPRGGRFPPKYFPLFDFDPITLRIGPFGVDDEKFSFCKNFCPGLPGHA